MSVCLCARDGQRQLQVSFDVPQNQKLLENKLQEAAHGTLAASCIAPGLFIRGEFFFYSWLVTVTLFFKKKNIINAWIMWKHIGSGEQVS